jgi:hypothetical protein
MAKPKAPEWLREAFRDGVDERGAIAFRPPPPAYPGADPLCFLADHDPRRRPCSGRLERFHFISRQRVEHALAALLHETVDSTTGWWILPLDTRDLILLAAWDARNGGIACEGHHRRFDAHATPTLKVPRVALPSHVLDFVGNWGLDEQVERRFPFS